MRLSVFQIVVLCSFGALGVAGALIFALLVGRASTESIGSVVIWGTLDERAFTPLLRQLSDEDGRLRQVSYVPKQPETFERELADALASGTGPDLFVIRQDSAEKNSSKILPIPYTSLSAEQFKDTFIEAAEPYLGSEGVLAVPFLVDPLLLYWNRDMLSSAGFPQPPAYWDEVFGMATKITKRSQTNTIEKSAIAFGEYQNVNNAKDILAMLMLQAGSPIMFRDSEALTPALVSRQGDTRQPVESAVRYFTDFANPVKAHYSWNRSLPESRAAFAAGDLALYVGYASEDPLIRRINPNINYAPALIPQIRDGDRFTTYGRVYAFAVPRAARNPQGALTVAYLLASARSSELFAVALGFPSARRDVLAKPVTGKDDLFNRQAIISRAWSDPSPERTELIFREMIESVTSGSARLSEAVQRAEQAMRELLSV